MSTFHIFQCREGEFTYQADSKADATDKALASYLVRKIRANPHADAETFVAWRADFLALLQSAHYRIHCQ